MCEKNTSRCHHQGRSSDLRFLLSRASHGRLLQRAPALRGGSPDHASIAKQINGNQASASCHPLGGLQAGWQLSRVMDLSSQRASGGRFTLEPDPAIAKLEFVDIEMLAPKANHLNPAKRKPVVLHGTGWADTGRYDSNDVVTCTAD